MPVPSDTALQTAPPNCIHGGPVDRLPINIPHLARYAHPPVNQHIVHPPAAVIIVDGVQGAEQETDLQGIGIPERADIRHPVYPLALDSRHRRPHHYPVPAAVLRQLDRTLIIFGFGKVQFIPADIKVGRTKRLGVDHRRIQPGNHRLAIHIIGGIEVGTRDIACQPEGCIGCVLSEKLDVALRFIRIRGGDMPQVYRRRTGGPTNRGSASRHTGFKIVGSDQVRVYLSRDAYIIIPQLILITILDAVVVAVCCRRHAVNSRFKTIQQAVIIGIRIGRITTLGDFKAIVDAIVVRVGILRMCTQVCFFPIGQPIAIRIRHGVHHIGVAIRRILGIQPVKQLPAILHPVTVTIRIGGIKQPVRGIGHPAVQDQVGIGVPGRIIQEGLELLDIHEAIVVKIIIRALAFRTVICQIIRQQVIRAVVHRLHGRPPGIISRIVRVKVPYMVGGVIPLPSIPHTVVIGIRP